jgi:Tetratricopeptide repeat
MYLQIRVYCNNKAVEIDANFSLAYNNKGEALFKSEKYSEAIDAYNNCT